MRLNAILDLIAERENLAGQAADPVLVIAVSRL
jgi:hypothetical protein